MDKYTFYTLQISKEVEMLSNQKIGDISHVTTIILAGGNG